MLSNHPSVLGGGAVSVTTPAATSASLDLISSTQGAMLYRNATEWVGLGPGTSGQLLSTQGAAANPLWVTATGGAGDFNGPASATDNAIVRFDGTGGKTGQNSVVTIADTTGAIAGASSLTAPASTDLTLSGGSSGASLVLGQGTTAGAFTLTPTGTGSLTVNLSGSGSIANSTWNSGGATAVGFDYKRTTATAVVGGGLASINAYNAATRAAIFEFNGDGATDSGRFDWWVKPTGGGLTQVMTLKSTGNLLIGTTTDMSGSGGLKVAGTTASTGVSTGALQVAGGIYAGAASVFGGNLNVEGAGYLSVARGAYTTGAIFTPIANSAVMDWSGGFARFWGVGADAATAGGLKLVVAATDASPFVEALTIASTGAATFAGAVAISNTVGVAVAAASTHKVTMVIGGVTYYLLASNV
jgi:hypothetical protein